MIKRNSSAVSKTFKSTQSGLLSAPIPIFLIILIQQITHLKTNPLFLPIWTLTKKRKVTSGKTFSKPNRLVKLTLHTKTNSDIKLNRIRNLILVKPKSERKIHKIIKLRFRSLIHRMDFLTLNSIWIQAFLNLQSTISMVHQWIKG